MIFGLATIGIYFYLISSFDTITLSEGKNFLIILPILFILAFCELFFEIKYGIKKVGKISMKLIKTTHQQIKYRLIQRKIKKNKKPSDKQLEWLRKYKEKKQC